MLNELQKETYILWCLSHAFCGSDCSSAYRHVYMWSLMRRSPLTMSCVWVAVAVLMWGWVDMLHSHAACPRPVELEWTWGAPMSEVGALPRACALAIGLAATACALSHLCVSLLLLEEQCKVWSWYAGRLSYLYKQDINLLVHWVRSGHSDVLMWSLPLGVADYKTNKNVLLKSLL